MARRLTPDECRRFLTEKPRTATIGTVRPDGRPHVAAIWFDLDGDTLVFTTWHDTVKKRNLDHNSRVTICVDDEQPPFAYVQIEGTAELSENDPEHLYWSTRIAGRYMGQDQAEAYGKRNAVEGEWLVRVKIAKMLGEENISGW
jgi:PPOX class probable F420-dependent enzyme